MSDTGCYSGDVTLRLFGLVAANVVVTGALLRRGRSAPPLRMTGPVSHLVNLVVGTGLDPVGR